MPIIRDRPNVAFKVVIGPHSLLIMFFTRMRKESTRKKSPTRLKKWDRLRIQRRRLSSPHRRRTTRIRQPTAEMRIRIILLMGYSLSRTQNRMRRRRGEWGCFLLRLVLAWCVNGETENTIRWRLSSAGRIIMVATMITSTTFITQSVCRFLLSLSEFVNLGFIDWSWNFEELN